MLNPKIFKEIAPTTDDIWFWAAAVANGTYVVPFPYGKYNKPKGLKKPKNLSLKTVNFKKGSDLNRLAFEKILNKYPIVKKGSNCEQICSIYGLIPIYKVEKYLRFCLDSLWKH